MRMVWYLFWHSLTVLIPVGKACWSSVWIFSHTLCFAWLVQPGLLKSFLRMCAFSLYSSINKPDSSCVQLAFLVLFLIGVDMARGACSIVNFTRDCGPPWDVLTCSHRHTHTRLLLFTFPSAIYVAAGFVVCNNFQYSNEKTVQLLRKCNENIF